MYDPVDWAVSRSSKLIKQRSDLSSALSIVGRFPLKLVSSSFLIATGAAIVVQFPCLMINIMLDIPSININAPF